MELGELPLEVVRSDAAGGRYELAVGEPVAGAQAEVVAFPSTGLPLDEIEDRLWCLAAHTGTIEGGTSAAGTSSRRSRRVSKYHRSISRSRVATTVR